MAESSGSISPQEAVELFRAIGSEPPEWLLREAGMLPKQQPPKKASQPEDHGWYHFLLTH